MLNSGGLNSIKTGYVQLKAILYKGKGNIFEIAIIHALGHISFKKNQIIIKISCIVPRFLI